MENGVVDIWISRLLAGWLGLTGLTIGSFLNVVIARVPREESIVRPRSRCPKCGHTLAWYENIPLFSYLALRGKCRSCKAPISARYPLVELLTGLLFLACLSRFGWSWELARAIALVSLLVPLTFIDLEHWILPFSLTLPGLALGLFSAVPLGRMALEDAVIGAVAGFLSFRAMEWLGWVMFKKEALGAGDKFLLALLGAFLGWRALLGIILLASVQGSVVGLASILLIGRAHAGTEEPAEPPPATMTWEFLKPGLPFWKRLLLLPVNLLLQPIPDAPLDEEGEELDWTPGVTNIPFGPWLALGGLEVLLLGPWLGARVADLIERLTAG